MPQQQVPPRKPSRAFGAFERLFLGVRSFMSFEMFQPGKRSSAGGTHVRSGFIGFGRWEGGVVTANRTVVSTWSPVRSLSDLHQVRSALLVRGSGRRL